MPYPKKEEFIKEVLHYIKFPFDRNDIKFELEGHILDKMEYYTEKGYDKGEAEQLSINEMGDPKEIGIQLNKQHNPLLGWVWKITNTVVILFVVLDLFLIGIHILGIFDSENFINNIDKSNIVYKIDVDEKVKLDDTIIHFTNVVYEQNGDMSILYEYYDTKLWGTGWSGSILGSISDNLGNTYFDGSGASNGGIKTKSIRTVENFSSYADTLIISYDNYNRKYKIEIPLQAGDNNE